MASFWNLSDKEMMVKIGEKLKALRLKADVSQQYIADQNGMSRSSIVDMEKGNNFTLQSLLAYLRTINQLKLLEEFFKEEEQPISPVELLKLQKKNNKQRAGHQKSND